MPRIAKWKEKSQCVKYNLDKEFRFFDETTSYNKVYNTLYDLIDKTIREAMEKGYKPEDDFSQFVNVKEVPHG
jgi:hypothetical protein